MHLTYAWDVQNDETYYVEDNGFQKDLQDEPFPMVVAAICGTLLACGLLPRGSVITAVRKVSPANPWKMAGILEIMAGRVRNRL